MLAWFVTFLACLAFPPLLILWVIAVLTRTGRIFTHKAYRKEVAHRDRDIPPRGYRSGQALINNRVQPSPLDMKRRKQ